MARMIYDIKVVDDQPDKAKINRLLYDGSIQEMCCMLMYPISKMIESSIKEWGQKGGEAFKMMLLKGIDVVYREQVSEYLKAQDQGGV